MAQAERTPAIFLARSGATGNEIYRVNGTTSDPNLGYPIVNVGDTNGDGLDDLAVRALPGSPNYRFTVNLYTARDGAWLRTINNPLGSTSFGSELAAAGDFNQDGYQDVLIGAPKHSGSAGVGHGAVFVYSGFDGSVLMEHYGATRLDELGSSVAGIGDINGDGYPDILVGSQRYEGFGSASHCRVYSGGTGQLLYTIEDPSYSIIAGDNCIPLKDLDGDGIPDFGISTGWSAISHTRGEVSLVNIYSGQNGSLVRSSSRLGFGTSGSGLAALGDLNNDGVEEYSNIGDYDPSPLANNFIYSAASGRRWKTFDALIRGPAIGSIGDINGDGFGDIAVGNPNESAGGLPYSGVLRVYHFDPMLSSSAAEVSASNPVQVDFAIDFPNDHAGSYYMLLATFAGIGASSMPSVDIPLIFDPLTWRMMRIPPTAFQNSQGFLNASGNGQASLLASSNQLLPRVGSTLRLAAVAISPFQMDLNQSSAPVLLEIIP